VELYLHSPIRLQGVVLNLSNEYFFMAWHLAKHRYNFTFTFTGVAVGCYRYMHEAVAMRRNSVAHRSLSAL
jgi:hypothetical protein